MILIPNKLFPLQVWVFRQKILKLLTLAKLEITNEDESFNLKKNPFILLKDIFPNWKVKNMPQVACRFVFNLAPYNRWYWALYKLF